MLTRDGIYEDAGYFNNNNSEYIYSVNSSNSDPVEVVDPEFPLDNPTTSTTPTTPTTQTVTNPQNLSLGDLLRSLPVADSGEEGGQLVSSNAEKSNSSGLLVILLVAAVVGYFVWRKFNG